MTSSRMAGVCTVQDLIQIDPATVRRRWSVVLERTVRELQGVSCIGLEDGPTVKKEIASTRSFGHAVTELVDLIEAVTEFSSRAITVPLLVDDNYLGLLTTTMLAGYPFSVCVKTVLVRRLQWNRARALFIQSNCVDNNFSLSHFLSANALDGLRGATAEGFACAANRSCVFTSIRCGSAGT